MNKERSTYIMCMVVYMIKKSFDEVLNCFSAKFFKQVTPRPSF